MLKLVGWLLSLVMAFSIGAGVRTESTSDSELKDKVQSHMDVIIDEAAGIVDDVTDEMRKDDRVKDAEAFVDDVQEIIDNTRDDIKAHFGKDDKDDAEIVEDAIESEGEELQTEINPSDEDKVEEADLDEEIEDKLEQAVEAADATEETNETVQEPAEDVKE